jgi:hypothetical protein
VFQAQVVASHRDGEAQQSWYVRPPNGASLPPDSVSCADGASEQT